MVHGFVVLAVLVQLGFALAFLVDAARTNTTYDALSSHRVAVQAQVTGCFTVVTGRMSTYSARLCRVRYQYAGTVFTAYVPNGETMTFYVDPRNTSYRMNAVNFEKGPEATIGDEVFAAVCGFGALAVTLVHVEHLRARRAARKVRGSQGWDRLARRR